MKIAVVTGTRADFGILSPLIGKILKESEFVLKLVVTGMHLSSEFGFTLNEIENAGFIIDKKVECLVSSDTAVGVSKSIGVALLGFADVFEDLEPDLVLLLGDRTEILAAAIAATVANIPIAHLHGGETTEGAYDESIRHAITKMSYWHFVSTEEYRLRVIQLGEEPDRVFNVGALGIDSIKSLELLDKAELEDALNFQFGTRNILITYHPVTLEKKSAGQQFTAILAVLEQLKDFNFIFTYANSDRDGRVINKLIEKYVEQNRTKAVAFKSLGQLRYFSTLKYVDLVMGNSSSGILEVPYFGIPTINIGDRQKGRLAPQSVIQAAPEKNAIEKAVDKALDPHFVEQIVNQEQFYGSGQTADQIIETMKTKPIENLKKPFYDIPFQL